MLKLKLKLQCFGHLMQRADSLEKTLILGKIEGKRRKGRQRMRWLDSITNSMGMNLSKLQDTVKDRRARQLNNNYILLRKFCLLIFRKYQQLLFLFYIYIRVYIHMYVCVYMYSVSVCTHRPRLRYTHTHMYWVGQNVHSEFSVRCYRKTQIKLFGQPNISMLWVCSARLFATHGL